MCYLCLILGNQLKRPKNTSQKFSPEERKEKMFAGFLPYPLVKCDSIAGWDMKWGSDHFCQLGPKSKIIRNIISIVNYIKYEVMSIQNCPKQVYDTALYLSFRVLISIIATVGFLKHPIKSYHLKELCTIIVIFSGITFLESTV